MSKSFYNTISATGQTLIEFERKSLTQEDKVLFIFLEAQRPLGWHQVASFTDMNEVSLKRAITNLAIKGKLVKTTEMVLGCYGKQVHKYALVK